jgi:lipid II:glycine glycyltransferase (peptidoglycan interpeptide bridge formation enzyme)
MRYKAEYLTDRESWNHLTLAMPDCDFRQGFEWGEFQRRRGWIPYRLAVLEGNGAAAIASIIVRKLAPGTVMYAPRGPLLTDGKAARLLIAAIRKLGIQTGAILFRASPPPSAYQGLVDADLRPLADHASLWNTARINAVMDLPRSFDDLRQRMRKKTRQYLDRSAKHGVEFTNILDPDRLYALMHRNALRQSFEIPAVSHYRALCEEYRHSGLIETWFASYQGEDLAGLLTITYGGKAYLRHMGLNLGRRDNLKAGYGIYWHAIRLAHERGCGAVDWGAVFTHYPPREGERGYPLYHFKAGFGCRLDLAPPYCDLVLKHHLYTGLRIAERTIAPIIRKSLGALRAWSWHLRPKISGSSPALDEERNLNRPLREDR